MMTEGESARVGLHFSAVEEGLGKGRGAIRPAEFPPTFGSGENFSLADLVNTFAGVKWWEELMCAVGG